MTLRCLRAAGAWVALAALASAAAAQQRPDGTPREFSLEDVLSAPFPEQLVVAPGGARIAWLGDEEGRRNVWTAAAPSWTARRLTHYADDDGQALDDLAFSPDGRFLLYTRGGDGGANWDETQPANPTSDPRGTEQAVYAVAVAGQGTPRRLGAGHGPVASPDGTRVVWIYRDTLYAAPLARPGPPRVLLRARGRSAEPAWSPDGGLLAFVSERGDHSFIGVYDADQGRIRWMAPTTNHDDLPRWSPDGAHLAFVRRAGSLYPTAPHPAAAAEPGPPPFTIMVADARTGDAVPVYRSPAGPDGAFPGIAGEWGLLWPRADRIVFASELGGWIGLYVLPAAGGDATRLTPGDCEVETVMAGDDGRLYYAGNCGDVDRRHAWRVPLEGGAPQRLTAGAGIEWSPVPLEDGRIAVLRSGAHRPAAPAVADTVPSDTARIAALDGWPLPERFPIEALVAPESVVVEAADSTPVHLQVFAPAGPMPPGRRPAVIFLHGGPRRQMLLGWHPMQYYHNAYAMNQYLASRGFVVVSVNYRGGVGYGRAFREAPRRGRFGASEYADVLAAAAYLRSRADVDSAQIGLWGGSYGGFLTALGLARNSDLFAAGVDLHGVHDWAEDGPLHLSSTWGVGDSAVALARASSPNAAIAQWRSPVLLIQGDDDRNVEFRQTVDLYRRLELKGVDVAQLVFPDEIHDFLRHDTWLRAYRAGAEFLAAKLRRPPGP